MRKIFFNFKIKSRFMVILLLLFSVSVKLGFSLDAKKKLSHFLIDHYSIADGLPQNSILSIVQTDDGYLWMGTYEGLVRYDGVTFQTFNKKNVKNFKNNSVNSLYKDSRNRLWIGTPDGLICYVKDKFIRYSTDDGLVGNFILNIYEDRKKNIWVGSTDGLSLKIGSKFKNYTKKNGLAHNYVLRIVDDMNGNLLVSTGKIGFDLIQKDKIVHFSNKNGLQSNLVRTLYRLTDGRVLVGTRGGGISVFKDGKISQSKFINELSSKDVMVIYQDVHGTIWIGTEKNGLYCYKDGILSNRSINKNGKNSLIRTLFEDREGSLWIGSKLGLFRIKDGKYSVFNSENGLTFNNIRSVFEDSRGRLWLGSEGKGMFFLDFNKVPAICKNISLKNVNVLSITEDSEGNIWYGTLGNGVFKVRDDRLEAISTIKGLSNNSVRVVFSDSKDNLWIGTNGGGVNKILNGNIIRFSTKNGLSDDFIYSINEDLSGRIWIGTYSGGLNRIDEETVVVYGKKSGLKDNIYWSIYPDKDGGVWFGTNGGGIYWFKDEKFTNFGTEHGLYSDLAFQILEAPIYDHESGKKQNYLWMNTNNGVFVIKKKELEQYVPGKSKKLNYRIFGKLDRNSGIIGGGPAQPAGWKGTDGNIYFNGKNGLSVFNSENIFINKVPPSIVIKKLEVDRIKIDGIDYLSTDKIIIPPGKTRFEFFYTGLSYLNTKGIRYRYKIEGIDKNWVDAGVEKKALYMNIPPGPYSFKLIAYNSDGVRSKETIALNFELEAFFWQTLWFKIGLMIILFSILIVFIRLRIQQVRNKLNLENKKRLNLKLIELEKNNLEKELSLKRDFNAMLIHDLKSPITALIGYSEMIENFPEMSDQKIDPKRIGKIMSRSLGNIMNLVNKMLDLSKFEAGKMKLNLKKNSLVDVVEDVLEVVKPLIKNKSIKIKRRYMYNSPVTFDPDKIRQVIHNLISNSIKFSPKGGTIYFKIMDSVDNYGFVEFAVIDEGIGVEKNRRKDLFKMYSQLGSYEENKKGTGLGLNISRMIIEAHKGHIDFRENPTGKGSVFFFTLSKD